MHTKILLRFYAISKYQVMNKSIANLSQCNKNTLLRQTTTPVIPSGQNKERPSYIKKPGS